MTTLTLDSMQALHGAWLPRPPRGAFCGVMTGALIGFIFLGNPVAAALTYMFTPVTCLLDYAL